MKRFLLALWLLGCTAGLLQAAEPNKTYLFTVLHTNDLHGRFWSDSQGQYGLAAQKALIDSIRAEVQKAGGYTLLLNAGDVNTGVPESDALQAEPMFRAMNAIGYDAMVLGSHEFDNPRNVLRKQQAWADFPILSANFREHGKRPFPAVVGYKLGGLKVAIIGLTTPDTPRLTNPNNMVNTRFADSISEAKKLLPSLRKQADVVIALTHLGYDPDGLHGNNAAGDVELARMVPGIDLIVGGHSHTVLCLNSENRLESNHVPGAPCRPDRQNGSWIMQAGEWGQYVGRADFSYRNGQLILLRYSMLPVNLKHLVKEANGIVAPVNYTTPIVPDAALQQQLAVYQHKGQNVLSTVVGQLDGALDGGREHVRHQPTSMGIFAASALKGMADADLALINSGGIRDSLSTGEVSRRDVLKVFPFASTVVTVELDGSQLMALLRQANSMPPGSGGYPQYAGVRLELRQGELVGAVINGKPVEATGHYRLATNSFLAAGGDGYPVLNKLPGFRNTHITDVDVLSAWLTERSPVRAADYAPATHFSSTQPES